MEFILAKCTVNHWKDVNSLHEGKDNFSRFYCSSYRKGLAVNRMYINSERLGIQIIIYKYLGRNETV